MTIHIEQLRIDDKDVTAYIGDSYEEMLSRHEGSVSPTEELRTKIEESYSDVYPAIEAAITFGEWGRQRSRFHWYGTEEKTKGKPVGWSEIDNKQAIRVNGPFCDKSFNETVLKSDGSEVVLVVFRP